MGTAALALGEGAFGYEQAQSHQAVTLPDLATSKLYLTPKVIQMIGDQACCQLESWGEQPYGVQALDGGALMAIGFWIIPDEPGWRKTIECGVFRCRADEIHDQLNAWREKTRQDLKHAMPHPIIQKAINIWGREAVDKALEHRSRPDG